MLRHSTTLAFDLYWSMGVCRKHRMLHHSCFSSALRAIEYFGGVKKLFIIYFRNVSALLPIFHEAYLNEGYMDMYKIIRTLRKVDFDGVLIADHWPTSVAGPLVSHIYTIGYIQSLIERATKSG